MYRRAFTLLELLVSIAVIGILMALFIPGFSRIREQARSAQCANNLRQLGVAMHLYADDHDGRLPDDDGEGSPYWFNIISGYIDDPDVFKCPSFEDHVMWDYRLQSYAYNVALANVGIDTVRSSSYCMLITDSQIVLHSYIQLTGYGNNLQRTVYYIERADPPADEEWQRHLGGINIVFVDGHVRWHRISDIPTSGPEGLLWWNK